MEEEGNKKQHNEHRGTKIIAVLGLVITFIILYITKTNVDSFSVKWFVIIMFIGAIFWTGIWFMYEIPKFFVKKEASILSKSHPKPKSKEEMESLLEDYFIFNTDYLEYIDTSKPHNSTVEAHGKNGDQFIFSKEFTGQETGWNYFIAINMHYPDKCTILINSNAYNKHMAKKKAAIDPELPGDKTIIERIDPLSGRQEKQTTTTHSKRSSEKDEKRGDLK